MEFADRHELAYKDINLEEKFERSNLVLSLNNKRKKCQMIEIIIIQVKDRII